ncbi:VOC family protein [Candidatus Berkelbacteria bacterium]|nr:VOC family protein [Candidatus Berkelbacteria bacterium]
MQEAEQRITPSLWIAASAKEVADYYQGIFKAESTVSDDASFDETPSGETQIFNMNLKGLALQVMCTGKHDDFTDAVSFVLPCRDQAEIDYFWNAFTNEGKASRCGWCQDKYGVRWQVIPENLGELMSRPGGMETMLKQGKIIVDEY